HSNHTTSHNKAMVLHKAVTDNLNKVLDNNLLNKATVSQILLKTKAVVMRIITIQASLLLRILIKIKKQKTICLFNFEIKTIILNPDYICNRDFFMYKLTKELFFPNVETAHSSGIVAFGGDLSTDRLILAYQSGIFPWFE